MDGSGLDRAIAAARPAEGDREAVLRSARAALFAATAAPDRIDRYLIERRLGAGGMGVVWAARDRRLGRTVAIKLLKRCDHPDDRARLMREAQAMARVAHPNVVEVYDVGTHNGQVFIAMELIHGCTLATWLRPPRPWREVIEVFAAAGRGLHAAHRAELVHRDFKSANVMRGDDGRVRVMDFGLAHHLHADTEGRPDHAASLSPGMWLDAALTSTGQCVGTPSTMAPEQHDGGPVDSRADQFGFCVALWEALVRGPAFAGRDLRLLAIAKREGAVIPPPRDLEAPARVLAVVRRGLAPAPDDRYPDMGALLAALDHAVARPRRWLAATLVTVGVASVAYWAGVPDPCEGRTPAEIARWAASGRASVESAFDPDGDDIVVRTRIETMASLDSQVAAWSRARGDVCEQFAASDPARTQVGACVERRGAELAALLAALGADGARRPEPGVLANAIAATSALAPAAECFEPGPSTPRERLPSDSIAAPVAAAREQLASVHAMQRVGRFTRAHELVNSLVPIADGLEYPPLDAEVQFALGEVLIDEAQYDEAQAALRRAYFTAWEHDLVEIAAESSTLLVFVLGSYLARPDEALDWARHAEAAIALLDDPSLAADLDTNVGMVLAARGQIAEARTHLRRAIARTATRGDIGTAMQYLATLSVEAGELAEARAMLERVIEIRERHLGPGHTLVAVTRVNLANTLLLSGEYDEALRQHREGLAIQIAALGPDHAEVAVTRNNLGGVLDSMGDLEGAREQHAMALGTFESTLGSNHPYVGVTAVNVGRVDVRRGDLERALPELERGRAILEHALGSAHPHVDFARLGLAELELARHRPERALAVLPVARTECGETARTLCAELMFARAKAQHDSGDGAAADQAAAAALALLGTTVADAELRQRITAWDERRLDAVVAG